MDNQNQVDHNNKKKGRQAVERQTRDGGRLFASGKAEQPAPAGAKPEKKQGQKGQEGGAAGGGEAAQERSLGSICENMSPFESRQKAAQELKQRFYSFYARFRLQRTIGRIISYPGWDDEKEKVERAEGKIPRICLCLKAPQDRSRNGDGSAKVWLREGADFGHYGGLQTCGSVWVCPICAPKITEKRAIEINECCQKWVSENPENSMLMVTYTIPHKHHMRLAELVDKYKVARREMRRQGKLKRRPWLVTWKEIREKYRIKWSVYCLEVNYGYNGWHPHTHDLYLIEGGRGYKENDIESLRVKLTETWLYACKKAKIEIQDQNSFEKYAVQIEVAKTPADYIAKWGLDDYGEHKEMASGVWGAAQEMAKAHLKKGRSEHYSAWDLARMVSDNPGNKVIFKFFGSRFREFAQAMKGSHQIQFEDGMKKYFGISKITDEEIAADEMREESVLMGVLKHFEWKKVCEKGSRAHVLVLAGKMSWDDVLKYVENLFEQERVRVPA